MVGRRYLIDIWRFVYTFSNICKNLAALGVRNALWSVESSQFKSNFRIRDFFKCRYTALPVQHTRIQKKQAFVALNLAQDHAKMHAQYVNNISAMHAQNANIHAQHVLYKHVFADANMHAQ